MCLVMNILNAPSFFSAAYSSLITPPPSVSSSVVSALRLGGESARWPANNKAAQIRRYERSWINDDVSKDRGVFVQRWGTCKYTRLLAADGGKERKRFLSAPLERRRSVNKRFIVYHLWFRLLFTRSLSASFTHSFIVFRWFSFTVVSAFFSLPKSLLHLLFMSLSGSLSPSLSPLSFHPLPHICCFILLIFSLVFFSFY